MHQNTKKTIWAAAILAVIILFGIFMVVTVPEVNTLEEVQEVEASQ